MNHCRRSLGWGAVFIVVCQFESGLAQAAPPPLRPNEEVVKTKDGCGMVIDKTSSGATYQRKAFSELTWGGACVDGLAMGEGILSAGFKFPNQPAMLPISGPDVERCPVSASQLVFGFRAFTQSSKLRACA